METPVHVVMLPTEIHLSYRTFEIDVDERAPVGSMHGFYDPYGSLRINPHFNPEEVVNTVFHELLHAIWHLYSVSDDQETEEKLVNVFGNGLTEVIKRNPKLLLFFWESLHGGEEFETSSECPNCK